MGREMCTSQHFANWICGNKLDPYYLQQVFRHMSREWERLVAGSVLPDIYMGTFKALQILLPPLAEQKKIGEVGVAFDLRIEEERSTLTALSENRKALAQELLSGRVRLPDSMIAHHRDKAGQAA
ncbi:restriction endonuclease subunit S [Brytella acorum]|uniref:Restriction endonuclease subunit S n=3 Tax=Acetobacteraceae TaxID=433 RepID=A0AA35UUA2_9PROT|nr:restriction endonuclease subunit S [Brytella acorum]